MIELRTPAEVERYRWLGEHAGVAMTHALFHLRPGLTEQQIAALLAEVLIGFGIQPTVPVALTIEGVAQGRDEILEKAIKVVSE